VRFEDFSTVTRDCTVTTALSDASGIRQAAGECLKRVRLEKRIRLLGVRASALVSEAEEPEEATVQRALDW